MVAPLATPGTTLPGGFVIRKSRIRGEESQGMLCSASELEISEDHEGILDLDRVAKGAADSMIGRPLDELLGPPETVLEVEVPFNRPDGLGVVGLAREIKAALGGSWSAKAAAWLGRRWSGASDFDLELEDPEGCPRYIAQVVEGIAIGPSPAWLRKRLESVGQRGINSVVDITNFVLFELGQPLHAFDLDRLRGPAIRVRRARAGERITTLDGKDRELNPEVLVIADRTSPVAIAGVMGGAESEVSDSTTRLLLECAWFEPRRVRRGARSLGLATEASRRFERGVDPQIGPAAVARFLGLLEEVASGVRLGPARERNVIPCRAPTLELRTSRCERLIGLRVTAEEAETRLRALEFTVRSGDPLQVTVPPWRTDVTLEDDLVEEVARSLGYDSIPEVPLETGGAYAARSPREILARRARQAMLARGITEAWCTALVSEREALEAARLLGDESPSLVRLVNPMSREGEILRPNLVPGLLRACAHNLRQGNAAVRLFEIGAGFRWPKGRRAGVGPPGAGPPGAGPAGGGAAGAMAGAPGSDRATDLDLPEEPPMLAAIVAGNRYAHSHDATQQAVDFDDARGLWEAWLEEMRVDSPRWRAYAAGGWKPGASAEVASGNSRIGWAGTLSQQFLRVWEIEAPVHLFVVLLDSLIGSLAKPGASIPGRFPPVRRDVAFFVPETLTHRDLEQALAAAGGEWLRSIELFDVYAGPGTPQGMKSMAYALQFEHAERTMIESEIQAIQDRMAAAVATQYGGRLREK
jgi:phenylalanyl-tRNA synthetase beta chain